MIEIVNRATGEVLDTDSVPGLAEVAALHDERIERLGELVEDLLDGEGARDGGGSQGPVVWDRLSPYQRTSTWRSLAEWVGWLRGRYPLAHRIPLCWWRHPELVEELTALWLAWRDAYVEKGAPLSGGADWHGRSLPEFLRRIGAGGWNLACEGEHRPLVGSLYDPRQIDDPDEFEAAINPGQSGREGVVMNPAEMNRALLSGEATQLGSLRDAPIAYDGRYWTQDGDGWQPVEAPSSVDFLEDAERRLALADRAVQGSESP